MDLGEKDKFELEKDGENHLQYHPSGISAEWHMGLVPSSTSLALCQGNQIGSSPCPPVSMVDSFCSTLWDHQSTSQGFTGTNASTNNVPIIKPVPGPSRLDMAWNPPNPMLKGVVMFPPSSIGLPPGLSQFPTGSSFIERAARVSCFSGGNFAGMVSPLESSNPFPNPSRTVVAAGVQLQMNELAMGEPSKDFPGMCTSGQQSNGGSSPLNSQKDTGNSCEIGDRGEMELSDSGQEETPAAKGHATKKRKRNTREMEIDQVREEPAGSVNLSKDANLQKDEQNIPTLATIKNNGKQAKNGSDPPKEDYIHVRARRGQATNSHSLAERVRREKISERMKYLQDLVPGCSKVTGKAVMLDEIINYVQSLQRQVEFLSMKLAAVNPQLDFNIEGLLSKDMLQSRPSSSSTIGFDITHPFLHLTSQGLVQQGNPGMGLHPDALRRAINAQVTATTHPYKEAKHQIPNSWDDEIHNVLSQMGFGTNVPLNIQEFNNKNRDGFPI